MKNTKNIFHNENSYYIFCTNCKYYKFRKNNKCTNKCENFILKESIDKMVEYATRKSLVTPTALAEGIVIRPLEECEDCQLGRLSFKVINPEFLIKYDE